MTLLNWLNEVSEVNGNIDFGIIIKRGKKESNLTIFDRENNIPIYINHNAEWFNKLNNSEFLNWKIYKIESNIKSYTIYISKNG